MELEQIWFAAQRLTMNNKLPLDKVIDNLESSFLFWDEKALNNFVRKWLDTVLPKGGDFVNRKGLCDTCIYDKSCSFPRKFPVHACDEFTQDKKKISRLTDRCNAKE